MGSLKQNYLQECCDDCYTIELPCCPENEVIQINCGISPSIEVTWHIEDQFGNDYNGSIETDSHGNFEIDLTNDIFPEGFVESTGFFTLYILNQPEIGAPVAQSMIFDSTHYTCVVFQFVQSSPESEAIIQ